MINKNNKEILDDLIKKNPRIKKMTYLELGIFLEGIGFRTDWMSLADAHEYLGGYKNEKRDKELKAEIEELHKAIFGY